MSSSVILMLKPIPRVIFAAAQVVVTGVAVILLAFKGLSSFRATGLAVVAVLNSIGILVLVMGYKNVTIKASPPTKSGS